MGLGYATGKELPFEKKAGMGPLFTVFVFVILRIQKSISTLKIILTV